METLRVSLKNCYGISSLEKTFDLSQTQGKAKVYSIYAPNGLMKTSFSRTFEALAEGEQPKEERFNRPSVCIVEIDGEPIPNGKIYVLKSEIELNSDDRAITNILINKESKSRYDSIISNQNKLKSKLSSSLQKKSKVKKEDIETSLIKDFETDDFVTAIELAKAIIITDDLENFIYNDIFDSRALAILESPEFSSKSNEFNQRYQALFDQAGTIYKRGIFNPIKADTSFTTLSKQGYFTGGHKVHLNGDQTSINYEELQERLRVVNESIDSDKELKALRFNLAKNVQTQALATLLENITTTEIDFLLHNIRPENQLAFKKTLWAYYIQNIPEAEAYLTDYSSNKAELQKIESDAASEAPQWSKAIELFNNRFVDMPFTLSLYNQVDAALGKDKARLKFTFKDGDDQIDCTRSEIKSLSQGEKRALYLLNFIFEVEDRKIKSAETLFIIDDVADSFDYKNKHAIIQYLDDISKIECFSQLILTHNFDFFRALANNFVHRDRCLMASRTENGITLSQAEGIKNYFIGKWKKNIRNSDVILCATVPFTRNLLEYTKGEDDQDYLKLTSLLHWKSDTKQITIGDYYNVYNNLFGTNYPIDNTTPFIDLLFLKADEIESREVHDGLNLEDKVLLSIAIRMKSEIFIIEEFRIKNNDDSYWCQSKNQFGTLIKKYSQEFPNSDALKVIEKVSITVSSNIHLNSFMYEPILDLTIEHLIKLYTEIKSLKYSINSNQTIEFAI